MEELVKERYAANPPMKPDNRISRVLIIVPAYNEEASIVKTIEEVNRLNKNLAILVVDDGSTDQTKELVKHSSARLISLPFNLGIGGAVQTGFKYALLNEYDVAVQVDGDGQHDLAYLDDLLKPILNDEADMSIGSRFIPPFEGYRSSFVRRIGIQFFAHLISFLTSTTVTDPTSGFRAFNRRMIKVFAERYPHDYPEPEAIIVAAKYGARTKEVPVKMRKRSAGHSSIRYLRTLYYMVKVTLAILLGKLKPKRSLPS